MASLSFNRDSQAGGRRDRRDDPDRKLPRFEDRTLLDMQFHEGGVVVFGQANVRKRAGEARVRAGIIEGRAVLVLQLLAN